MAITIEGSRNRNKKIFKAIIISKITQMPTATTTNPYINYNKSPLLNNNCPNNIIQENPRNQSMTNKPLNKNKSISGMFLLGSWRHWLKGSRHKLYSGLYWLYWRCQKVKEIRWNSCWVVTKRSGGCFDDK